MNNFKIILSSFILTSTLLATEIKFEAIEYFVPNSRVVINADIEDETGIAEARVYFKSLDSKIYPFVKMSCKASKCSAMLPMSDSDIKTFNYIILFENNKGEVFKTKIFEVSKRDMIELPSWQTFNKSPLEVKSELLLTPKEILGFRDDFSITPVKDREKYGVVAKIVNMQNAGIKKLDEIPNATYGGEISESGIDRGIEESIFTTKNMLIGGGILAGIMALSSSSKKSTSVSNLTPTGTNTNSYDLSANLEAPLVPPTVNSNSAIPTPTPSTNEIPTVPSGNLVPSGSDYELSANVDTPVVEPTNTVTSTSTSTSKSVDTNNLLVSYPNVTLPTSTQKSTTPPEPTLAIADTSLPPSPTLTPQPTATATPTSSPTVDTTVTSTDTTNGGVSVLTTSDGNSFTVTTTVTTTVVTNPSSEVTTSVSDSSTIDTARNCGENIISSGVYNESFKIDLKINAGSTKLTYNMFNSRDRILVYYENSLIYESGCVNFDGSELNDNNKRSPKSLSFNGQDNYISVEVSADCERSGQIDWSFSLSCP